MVMAVLFTACGSDTPELPSDDITAAEIRAGQPGFLHLDGDTEAPDFTLTDQDGRTVSLADFRGKWTVIDWIFTNCMTVCPIFTAELNIVRNGLGDARDRVQFLSLTFDPERDTQEAMKAHAERVGADDPGWLWLTGTRAETDAVAESYGFSYVPADPMNGIAMFDHTALLVIVDPDGQMRHRYLGTGWAADVVERLQSDITTVPGDPEVAEVANEPTEPATTNPSTTPDALLTEATRVTWEDWELEPGVTSQTLYKFPNTGTRNAYLDHVREEAAAAGITPRKTRLIAMQTELIDWKPDLVSGIGYFENLVVVVEADSTDAADNALNVLDDEWCCSAP